MVRNVGSIAIGGNGHAAGKVARSYRILRAGSNKHSWGTKVAACFGEHRPPACRFRRPAGNTAEAAGHSRKARRSSPRKMSRLSSGTARKIRKSRAATRASKASVRWKRSAPSRAVQLAGRQLRQAGGLCSPEKSGVPFSVPAARRLPSSSARRRDASPDRLGRYSPAAPPRLGLRPNASRGNIQRSGNAAR